MYFMFSVFVFSISLSILLVTSFLQQTTLRLMNELSTNNNNNNKNNNNNNNMKL